MRKLMLLAVLLVAGPYLVSGQTIKQHVQATDIAGVRYTVVNRDIKQVQEDGKTVIRFSEAPDAGVAWVTGRQFAEGTIEFDARGRDVLQKSFIGIAFHGRDNRTYEAIYFRPFNFQAADPIRHIHAVQYVCEPKFSWNVLRETKNGMFEKQIVPANVQPGDWFHARVVVKERRIKVFVNGADTPCLDVPTLNPESQKGMIGFWVGNESNGDFANLVFSKQ